MRFITYMSLKQESGEKQLADEKSPTPEAALGNRDFLLNRPYGTGDGENGNVLPDTLFRSLFLLTGMTTCGWRTPK
jgi:hypothetical protein